MPVRLECAAADATQAKQCKIQYLHAVSAALTATPRLFVTRNLRPSSETESTSFLARRPLRPTAEDNTRRRNGGDLSDLPRRGAGQDGHHPGNVCVICMGGKSASKSRAVHAKAMLDRRAQSVAADSCSCDARIATAPVMQCLMLWVLLFSVVGRQNALSAASGKSKDSVTELVSTQRQSYVARFCRTSCLPCY